MWNLPHPAHLKDSLPLKIRFKIENAGGALTKSGHILKATGNRNHGIRNTDSSLQEGKTKSK
jgi:hypothetical protein